MLQDGVDLFTSKDAVFHCVFLRMCQRDRRLQQAILYSATLLGTLVILSRPGKLEVLYKKLFRIVRLALLTGADIHTITLNETPIKVSALLLLQPTIAQNLQGFYEKKSCMEQVTQNAQRYRALLGFATSKATVFIISTTGIYRDVHIQQGIESRIPPEAMLNRPLDEVLPNPETALHILQCIREAYASNEYRAIEYGLWDRQYYAEIYPIQGADEVVLVCNRTQ